MTSPAAPSQRASAPPRRSGVPVWAIVAAILALQGLVLAVGWAYVGPRPE